MIVACDVVAVIAIVEIAIFDVVIVLGAFVLIVVVVGIWKSIGWPPVRLVSILPNK